MSDKREKKTTSESISYKVEEELKKYDAIILDNTIRKSWSESAKRIDSVEYMNIEMIAMSFAYLYLEYKITSIMTEVENVTIRNRLMTSPVSSSNVDRIIRYISTRRREDAGSKKKKSYLELWEKNQDTRSKIIAEIAIYSYKILESLLP